MLPSVHDVRKSHLSGIYVFIMLQDGTEFAVVVEDEK